jgi:hypothetical protein
MVIGGDLPFGGEVETAEEVRAMADKSMSIDKVMRCCRSHTECSHRPCPLSAFFLNCLALSFSSSVKELARFSRTGIFFLGTLMAGTRVISAVHYDRANIRTIVALLCGGFLELPFFVVVCGKLEGRFILDAAPVVLTTTVLANGLVKA